VQEALQREAEPLPLQTLHGPRDGFSARVPARLAEPPSVDVEHTLLRLDLGASAPATCWIFRREADLANDLQELGEQVLDVDAVEARQLGALDAGVVGEAPYLALEWLYRMHRDGDALLGLLKQRIATVDGHSIYCRHDELGYRETFANLFSALIASASFEETREPSLYTEVGIASVNGQRVGVQRLDVYPTPEGPLRAEMRASLLVPADPQTVRVQDTVEVQHTLADGSLLGHVMLQAVDGERVTRLELARAGGGQWAVDGTYQSKPVTARIQAGRNPVSMVAQLRALEEAIADGRGLPVRLQMIQWMPSASPLDFMAVDIGVTEALGGDRFRAVELVYPRDGDPDDARTGGLRMDLVLDARGSALEAEIPLGGSVVRIDRAAVHGAL
jgi:hypothetical protein